MKSYKDKYIYIIIEMPEKYVITASSNKLLGKTDEKNVQITRADNKKISADEVKEIFNNLKQDLDRKGKDYKIFVRGLGITRLHTLTKDNELDVKNDAEYFEGKVKNSAKFTDFFLLQITVIDMSPVNKNKKN